MNEASHPDLSLRAFAEMIALPAYQQVRILAEQKYPRQSAASFRVPYYRPALTAISRYYRGQHDAAVLKEALMGLPKVIGNRVRVANNERVLRAFQKHPAARRQILPRTLPTIRTAIEGVSLRLTYDLVGEESGRAGYFFFNCRAAALDPDVARLTLELAHWAMEQSDAGVTPGELEYVDLETGKQFRFSRRRQSSIRQAKENAKIVRQLWNNI